MSTTERRTLSSNSGVIPVATFVLGMGLSLIIISSGKKQDVVVKQIAGGYQNNMANVIGKNNASAMISPQQKSRLDSIDGSQFMMPPSNANPWISMTGQSDMMDMMINMMDMMMPPPSVAKESSNSSEMTTNSMQESGMYMMMLEGQ